MIHRSTMRIERLYVSVGHNFFGHHGRPASRHRAIGRRTIDCAAGRGIVGDRFFDHKPDYAGQITFFAREVYDALCCEFGLRGKPPSVSRRNVITVGMDLNDLIGREFELQGVRFLGSGECAPCYWMDQAFAPGAEAFLKGRGGLRARIIRGGRLRAEWL